MNQETPVPQSGGNRSRNLFLILTMFILVAILIALGFMAYQEGLFGESNRDAARTTQQEQRDRQGQPDVDADSPEDEDSPEANEEELISQTLECLNVYGTEYTFQFEYPEEVDFEVNTPEVPGDNCEITLTYQDATMVVGKDFGEGYPYNLNEGEFFIVGTVDATVQTDEGFLDVEYTLIRSTVVSDMSPETASSYRYGNLFDDCSPSDLIPELTDPCGAYVHPTAPGIRAVTVSIPDSLTPQQVDDVIEMFDQIALTFRSEALPY